ARYAAHKCRTEPDARLRSATHRWLADKNGTTPLPGPGSGVVASSLVPTQAGTRQGCRLQAVGDVVEGVGDRGLQELQRHDDQDGDEGQDEGVLHHALALLGPRAAWPPGPAPSRSACVAQSRPHARPNAEPTRTTATL